jgi:hypothetical protein
MNQPEDTRVFITFPGMVGCMVKEISINPAIMMICL